MDLPKNKDLESIFAYMLCQEDCLETDNYLIKDLSKLAPSRDKELIIVVERDEEKIDSQVSALIL